MYTFFPALILKVKVKYNLYGMGKTFKKLFGIGIPSNTFILYRMTIKNTVYLTLNYQTLRILVCHVKTCFKTVLFLKFDS